MSITDEQLDSIRARLAAATEGPWTVDDDDPEYIVFPEKGGYDGLVIAKVVDQDEALFPVEHNGQFIAHAPTDLAALLAEVERLRDELAKARAVTGHKVERVLHAVKPYVFDRLADMDAEDMAWDATRVALGGGDDA